MSHGHVTIVYILCLTLFGESWSKLDAVSRWRKHFLMKFKAFKTFLLCSVVYRCELKLSWSKQLVLFLLFWSLYPLLHWRSARFCFGVRYKINGTVTCSIIVTQTAPVHYRAMVFMISMKLLRQSCLAAWNQTSETYRVSHHHNRRHLWVVSLGWAIVTFIAHLCTCPWICQFSI